MIRGSRGFTMVELMIAIAIATVLSTVFIAISLTYVADVFRSRATAELAVESHFVLQTVIEDIRLAGGIAETNQLEDSNAPDGGWTTSDAANRFIIDSPALTEDRDIIYNPETGSPYSNQLIYFIDQGKLYRRILKDEAAEGNTAVTTCPADETTSTCPADRTLTENITDITLEFFNAESEQTDTLSEARSVKVGLVMSRRVFGKDITLNNSIQATLRNY